MTQFWLRQEVAIVSKAGLLAQSASNAGWQSLHDRTGSTVCKSGLDAESVRRLVAQFAMQNE